MRLLPLKLLFFLLLNLELSYAQVPPSSQSGHSEHEMHDKHGSSEKHDDPHRDHHEEEGHGEEHGHHDEFGENKAIQGVKEEGRFFKLSPEAIQTLKITWIPIERQGKTYIFPKSAIVQFQGEKGVYVYRDGWFHLIELKQLSELDDKAVAWSPEFQNEDQLVVESVPLVRVAHLQASGQGGEGHAH